MVHLRSWYAAVAVGALVAATAAGTSAAAASSTPSSSTAAVQRLTGQVPASVLARRHGTAGAATLLHAHKGGAELSLDFSMPLRHRAQLAQLINAEARTHRVLTHAQVYAEFSPSARSLDRLRSWLVGEGMKIVHVGRDRTSVEVQASTSTVERALDVHINDYRQHASGRGAHHVPGFVFYGNDTAPAVPSALGVTAVTGLSDADRFTAGLEPLTATSGAGGTGSSGVGSRPAVVRPDFRSGGYWASDVRSLYDIPTNASAAGQSVGFTLWGPALTQGAATAYSTTTGDTPITVEPNCQQPSGNCVGVAAGPNDLQSVLEPGDTSSDYSAEAEVGIDVEQAHVVAPGVGMKYYLGACGSDCNSPTDAGLEAALQDAADDPSLDSFSDSWGWQGEYDDPTADPFYLAAQNSFAIAAAAGVTAYQSSGDDGALYAGFESFGSDIVSVGGTAMFSSSSPSTYSTVTAWNDGGSWCSTVSARPSWQVGVGVTANAPCPGRVDPDISGLADPSTGVYTTWETGPSTVKYGQYGGTSVAAPQMNGMEALTASYVAAQHYSGSTPKLGFEAPMIYQLGDAPGDRYFDDVECGNTAMDVEQNPDGVDGDAAQPGWDAASGFGSIDWQHFSAGYAIALGAQGLAQPASLDTGSAFTCARSPGNAPQYGASLPTTTVGYAVGAATSTPWFDGEWLYNSARPIPAEDTIYRSSDGGASWLPTDSDTLGVSCVSTSTCVQVGDGGVIERSTDGGITWTVENSTYDKALTSVSCPTATVCYAGGARGAVLKSGDGGVTWTQLVTGDADDILGMQCLDANTCVAIATFGNSYALTTTDGGATWTQTLIGDDVYARSLSCTSATTCVAVGLDFSGSNPAPVSFTTGDGQTWAEHDMPGSDVPEAVSCSGGSCYSVYAYGSIATSSNGGVTWSAMTSNTSASLFGVSCPSASSCVADGTNGTVDVLANGTWAATAKDATSAALIGLSCTDVSDCVLVGAGGATVVLASGQSPALTAGGTSGSQLNSVSCDGAADCVAVGVGGTTLSTSDSGQLWVAGSGSGSATLNSVSCESSDCVAVGAGGAIVISADGGHTWTAQKSGTTKALYGVWCTASGACVAVGAGGTILTSPDGVTWTAATSGTTTSLAAVSCSSSNCFAAGAVSGASAVLLASTDGGATWAAQTSNSPQALNGISCVNASACFAAGNLGTVVSTVNGGASWAQQGNPLSGSVGALNTGYGSSTPAVAVNAVACSAVRCDLPSGFDGNMMTTPVLTVTVTASSPYGSTPDVTTGLAASDPELDYSSAGSTPTVTGTLTCQTTATSSSDPGQFPVSNCSGLSATGYSVVYDLTDSSYTVTKLKPTVTVTPIPDTAYGAPDLAASATDSANLPLTFSAAGPCTVDSSSGEVHITGAGTCTIEADQAATNDYAASSGSTSFQIAKADQTISVDAQQTQTYGSDFTIDATATSSLPVALQAQGPCTLDSTTAPADVHLTGTGSCSITASQAGNADYNAAPSVTRTFDVDRSGQTITFPALPNATYGDPDITPDASASSGLPVAYTAAGACTIVNGAVHLTGAGSCTVTATQAGNGDFDPAPDVAQTITVAKSAQTITFGPFAAVAFGAAKIRPAATATSGLPVSYVVMSGTACTVDDGVVDIVAVGTCTVTAEQPGDADYDEAPDVSQVLTVHRATPTVRIETGATSPVAGAVSFEVRVSGMSGAAPTGSVTVRDNGRRCTIRHLSASGRGSCALVEPAGRHTVQAGYGGGADYTSARGSVTIRVGRARSTVRVYAGRPRDGRVTYLVTVAGSPSLPPTGTVTVDDGRQQATVRLHAGRDGTATATCTLRAPTRGHAVRVAYRGDRNYYPAD